MNVINILPVGFSKKGISKLQKNLGNSFSIINTNSPASLKKLHLILINWKSEEVCNEVNKYTQEKQTNSLPVLLYTPINETLILQCFQQGIADFIDDNLSNEIIKAKLKALVNYHKKINSGKKKIKIGSVTINPKKRKVTRKGKEVDLTKIEYDILNLLASDRTKIYSRDEIYEHIWGRNVIVGERTLDVHMNNLRKKIGKNKIKTKKGIGFGINPDL